MTVFDPDDDLNFENISVHCLTLLMQYIDGFWINRIPIRFNHWWTGVFPLSIAYAVWTYIHGAVTDLGNPDVSDNDPSTNDDLIYDDIDWDNDFVGTLVFTLILVFGLGPIVQIILVLLSLYHIPCACMKDRRRYLDNEQAEGRRRRSSQEDESSHGGGDSLQQWSFW